VDLHGWVKQQHFVSHLVLEREVIARLDHAQMRTRTPEGGNSVAWLVWHVSRCEDVAVNAIVRGEPQVLASPEWRARLAAESEQIGAGMSDDEVTGLSTAIDLGALLDYREAVRDATSRWIDTIAPAALDEVPDLDARLAAAGRLWPEAGAWVRDMWQPWPASLFLNWVAIGHTLMRIGEMRTTMTRLGVTVR